MNEPFTVDVPVRFRDLDPNDHVNHVVYASYLEAARVEFLDTVLGDRRGAVAFVVANLEISYEGPVELGDDPTVALRVTDVRETSCTMDYEIRVDGDPVATAETVVVNTDESGRPETLPDAVRTRFLEHADGTATV